MINIFITLRLKTKQKKTHNKKKIRKLKNEEQKYIKIYILADY